MHQMFGRITLYALGKRALRTKLEKIRDLVDGTHWIQNEYTQDQDGKLCGCLVGLARIVCDVPGYGNSRPIYRSSNFAKSDDIVRTLLYAAQVEFPTHRSARMGSLETWNDARGRTREQVLRVIDRAIEATS